MAACRAEFVQLHGAPRVVQHQGARGAAQLDPAAAGQIQGLDVAEHCGGSAGGRHRVEGCVPCDEVPAGFAQILGEEEQPPPVGGLAHRTDGLPSGVGRQDGLRLPAGGRDRVDSAREIGVAALVKGSGEVDGAAVGAEAGAVVVGCPGGELLGGRQQAGGGLRGIGRGAEGLQGAAGRGHFRFGVQLRHLDQEQLQRLVGGIAEAVHPVLEIGDQPGVLAACADALDAAVPALLRGPGAEDDAPGIGRPGKGADPQRSCR